MAELYGDEVYFSSCEDDDDDQLYEKKSNDHYNVYDKHCSIDSITEITHKIMTQLHLEHAPSLQSNLRRISRAVAKLPIEKDFNINKDKQNPKI